MPCKYVAFENSVQLKMCSFRVCAVRHKDSQSLVQPVNTYKRYARAKHEPLYAILIHAIDH